MVTVPKLAPPRRIEIQAYEVPEYLDPQGTRITPLAGPYVISQHACDLFGLDPHALAVWQQPDNSNYQRIRRGDLCIIDLSDHGPQLQDAHKYLIQHRHGARVRRVFCHQDGSVELSPDTLNPTFRAELVPAATVSKLRIVGRVALVISLTD